jgi:hypothetical protein
MRGRSLGWTAARSFFFFEIAGVDSSLAGADLLRAARRRNFPFLKNRKVKKMRAWTEALKGLSVATGEAERKGRELITIYEGQSYPAVQAALGPLTKNLEQAIIRSITAMIYYP